MVSRQALENWLTKPFVKPEEHKSRSQSVSGDVEVEILPAPDILCCHAGLRPQNANNMKRMSRVSQNTCSSRFTKNYLIQKAYEKLSLREEIGPVRSPHEVCKICVKESFIGKLRSHVPTLPTHIRLHRATLPNRTPSSSCSV